MSENQSTCNKRVVSSSLEDNDAILPRCHPSFHEGGDGGSSSMAAIDTAQKFCHSACLRLKRARVAKKNLRNDYVLAKKRANNDWNTAKERADHDLHVAMERLEHEHKLTKARLENYYKLQVDRAHHTFNIQKEKIECELQEAMEHQKEAKKLLYHLEEDRGIINIDSSDDETRDADDSSKKEEAIDQERGSWSHTYEHNAQVPNTPKINSSDDETDKDHNSSKKEQDIEQDQTSLNHENNQGAQVPNIPKAMERCIPGNVVSPRGSYSEQNLTDTTGDLMNTANRYSAPGTVVSNQPIFMRHNRKVSCNDAESCNRKADNDVSNNNPMAHPRVHNEDNGKPSGTAIHDEMEYDESVVPWERPLKKASTQNGPLSQDHEYNDTSSTTYSDEDSSDSVYTYFKTPSCDEGRKRKKRKNDIKRAYLQVFENPKHERVWAIATIDERHFLSGSSDKTIKLWRTTTPDKAVRTFVGHGGSVASLEVIDDDTFVSGAYDKTIKVWNIWTGQLIRTLLGHQKWVRDLTYMGNKRLISASEDKTLKLWVVCTGQCQHTFHDHTDRVCSVAKLANDRFLSGSTDGTIFLWDFRTIQKCKQTFKGHTGWILRLVAVDENHFLSGEWKGDDDTIRFWRASTGECLGKFNGDWQFVALSTNLFVSISSKRCAKTPIIWNYRTNKQLDSMERKPFQGYPQACFSDNRIITSNSQSLDNIKNNKSSNIYIWKFSS